MGWEGLTPSARGDEDVRSGSRWVDRRRLTRATTDLPDRRGNMTMEITSSAQLWDKLNPALPHYARGLDT